MLEDFFELIVMFFGWTNLPMMFQIIMNEILWDIINTREVANFIYNMIVGIEKEKEYNKVVEEVVKRLVENGLYVKFKNRK